MNSKAMIPLAAVFLMGVAGCSQPVEKAARASPYGCVAPRYIDKTYYGSSTGKHCLRDDVLRWEDGEGKVYQRIIMGNTCPMRITAAWCMGGSDGEVKACEDDVVVPPNGTYKSEKYAAAEMNGTYLGTAWGSTIPAHDLRCLSAQSRQKIRHFSINRQHVKTASSMKNQGQQGSGTTVTNVNVESGTGVKGAVGRGVGNVIEDVTEGVIWDMLLN